MGHVLMENRNGLLVHTFLSEATGRAESGCCDAPGGSDPRRKARDPGRPDSYGGAISRKLKESGLLYASAARLRLEVLPLLMGQEIDQRESRASISLTPEKTVDWIVRGLKDEYGDTPVRALRAGTSGLGGCASREARDLAARELQEIRSSLPDSL